MRHTVLRNLTALSRRSVPAAVCRRHASNFGSAPGPPKLPAQEQAEFERLQRQAAVSSAFQPEAAAAETSSAAADATTHATSTSSSAVDSELREGGGLYRGAKPEFDGDKNPRTGEVGGPKNEPLRWGSGGDWSYNGKVTDF
ncbi:FMP21-like protein [Akanthomyces lecanii RCEF 1005]|uniref:Succinate dehydrogenase assembly factor 4, mitochondrial n=1 Tax=Akanthomyces lecanii RCEF 1005 TaxID=1081108 RepID=A0A168BCY6_CORDF|nr:FMP21-like protein [Akanthomyces lecanii RCEF 1005]